MRRTIREVIVWVGVFVTLSGITAFAETPSGVSPSGSKADSEVAVVMNTCPTFSWSKVSGAEGYVIEVYEAVEEGLSHDEMVTVSEPVISKGVGSALSWTPSGSECLKDGVRYVWFIGARKAEGGTLNAESGTQNVEPVWSEGKVFEVNLLSDAEAVDAVKETISSYLTNEWRSTESYTEMKKEIKKEITGSDTVSSQGLISITGNEGDSKYNTYYGNGAGASLVTTSCTTNDCATANAFFGFASGNYTEGGDLNTFIGDFAGFKNTSGDNNTFLGYGAGYTNQTGSSNVFIGFKAGYNETGSNKLYIDNSDTSSPLIYGDFTDGSEKVKINGDFEVTGALAFTGAGTPGNGKVLTSDASGNATWQTPTDNDTLGGLSCTNGQVAKWNGSAWECANDTDNDTTYSAGSGLNLTGTTFSVDTTTIQSRVSGSCSAGSSISAINEDGSVSCEVDSVNGETGDSGYNVYFGENTGTNLGSTGRYNTFFGYGAGHNVQYVNNTFIGYMAGYNVQSSHNTFVGYVAGHKVSDGFNNTFLGEKSGASTTTASYNTFVGTKSGYQNDTGSKNVFIGYSAGYSNASGEMNLFVGNSAGFTNEGSGNVFIGYQAGYNETGSNKLYIDNSDTSNPLIYGEFDNDLLKVNGEGGNSAKILVENVAAPTVAGDIGMFQLKNHSTSNKIVRFSIAGGGKEWTFDMDPVNDRFRISKVGTGQVEFRVEGNGDAHFLGNSYAVQHINTSSRDVKEGFEAVDLEGLLEKVAELPVMSWRYKWEAEGVRHIGPVAEDFKEVTGLGDGVHISTIDAEGVTIASVKALYERVKELKAEGENLKEENKKKKKKVSSLEAENKEIRAENQKILEENHELKEKVASLEAELHEKIAALERQ
ncbi:MAG: hypothetical protein D6726_09650, partial [Nitrospirae bacterium]